MTGCCDEAGCRRKTPIALYLGDLTGRVYAATRTRLRHRQGGTAYMVALEKHDVTEQVREFIRRNPEWVRAQLDGRAA